MDIKFYMPKDEIIPTKLRVKVDDKYDVYYDRLPDIFGWKFSFFKHQGMTLEIAKAITDKLVEVMIHQSYDHGAQWREEGKRAIINDDYDLSIIVFFRVRDAG